MLKQTRSISKLSKEIVDFGYVRDTVVWIRLAEIDIAKTQLKKIYLFFC